MPEEAASSHLKNAVRRYWNAHPIGTDNAPNSRGTREQYDAIYGRWKQSGTPKRKAFLAACRDCKVLEVGCGIATDGRYLSENGVDYQAVDLSIESLKLATEHFRQNDLRCRFANADATQLPFRDNEFDLVFSLGVLHHVPDINAACREAARILRPGGELRVALYCRYSYHYFLVVHVVRPIIWLLQHLVFGGWLARRSPEKLRHMYDISRIHGFDKQRLLNISTDTSVVGEDNFNPHSSFYSEKEIRAMFYDFEHFEFLKTNLQYFPLPRFRPFFERYLGFFVYMSARKSND